jgi:hypothetical protein
MRLTLLTAVVLLTLVGGGIPLARSDGGADEAKYEQFYTPPGDQPCAAD